MRIIDTRIETMQIELLEASKEIKRCTNCYNGHILLDTLGGRFDTYTNPEEALANKAFMIREVIDEKDSECDGSTCMRVSVVVDVFKRDNDEPRFTPCDENEIDRVLYDYYKKENEPVTPMVWHPIESGLPNENMTVLVITDKDTCFFGRYNGKKKLFISSSCKDVDYTDSGIPKYWAELPTIKTK